MLRVLTAIVMPMVFASAASAQTDPFPNRAIRIVVGFPAGGPSDVPARIIAEKLRVALGQPVIVENKTGAAGMIALNDVLAQPRDGQLFGDDARWDVARATGRKADDDADRAIGKILRRRG